MSPGDHSVQIRKIYSKESDVWHSVSVKTMFWVFLTYKKKTNKNKQNIKQGIDELDKYVRQKL